MEKSIPLVYESEYFSLFSDYHPVEIKTSGEKFHALFGYIFNFLSSEIEGDFISIKVINDKNIEIKTDLNSRTDVYFVNDDRLKIFSNDLDLIKTFSGISLEINQVSLAHSLSLYGSRPDKKSTLYTRIRRLGYRESLLLKDSSLNVKTNIPNLPKTITHYNELDVLNSYSETFIEALRKRASTERNVIFFSSGWDSTSIAIGLANIVDRKNIKCVIGEMKYSVKSGIANKFEIERAKKICRHLNLDLEIIKFDYSKELPSNIDGIINFLRSNQLASLTSVNHFVLSQAAYDLSGAHTRVFAGEMSDGAHNLGFSQFASLFHPNSIDFREYSDKMRSYLFGPSFLEFATKDSINLDPVWKLISSTIPLTFDIPADSIESRIKQFLISFFLRNQRVPFSPRSSLKLLTFLGAKLHEELLSEKYFSDLERYFQIEYLYSLYLHLYNSFHWQASTVNSIEISGRYFNLESVNPFHDTELIHLLQRMPESFGRGLELKPTKYPIKWMIQNKYNYNMKLNEGYHSYLYDVDPNFSHSAEILFRSSFTQLFKDNLNSQSFTDKLDEDVFETQYILTLIKRYLNREEIHQSEISDLMSICMHSLIL